jgi:outer membrane protein TolC
VRPVKIIARVALALSFIAAAGICPGCASEPEAPHWAGALPAGQEAIEVPRGREPAGPDSGVLTLDRAIDEALAASPELEQIRRRTDAATEEIRQAEASFYPHAAFTEDFNRTNNPVFALMDIINQRRLLQNTNFNSPGAQQGAASQVQAEWTFFEGGSAWYKRKAAKDQRDSVGAELAAAQNRLVASVSETYYRWLHALACIGVSERALDSAKTNQELSEARLSAETALPSEVLRFKTQTAEARSALLSAKTGARKLQASLERLLARAIAPSEIPEPATLSVVADIPVEDSGALVEKALRNRPEMESARSMIAASRDRVKAARGEFLPKLSMSSQYRWDSEDFNKTADSWMVGLQASWPLFDGGLRLSSLREARARLGEMESRGKQLSLDIALEVNQAAETLKEAAEKIDAVREQRDLAAQSLGETRRLYQSQVVGVDALMQAEVSSDRAEAAYMTAIFDSRISRALLRKALGDFAESVGGEK